MGPAPSGPPDPRRPLQKTFECTIDRRRFLVVVGGAAAYAAFRPHLAWARKLRLQPATLQPWSLPSDPPSAPFELTRTLIGAAALAPSHWNSQPWRFEAEGGSIRLVRDTQRSLPVIDPDQRSMMISLGAALENMLVTARAYGLRPQVTYFPFEGAHNVVADVKWTSGETRRDRGMFLAIPDRRTNRREYDRRGIFMQNRAQLNAQIPESCHLYWIDDREQIEDLATVVHDAVRARTLDPRAQAEQLQWMRFGDDEARRTGDGVTVDELEVGGAARWFARRYFDPTSWFLRFGAQSAAKQARAGVRSAGAVALLTTTGRGQQSWLEGGQAYERFALKATQLGIAHQPINAPIEMERFRAGVLRRFGAGMDEPLMLVRLGHAERPKPSMRRSVAVVSSFRNS